jgi:hypothetical protein
VQSLETSQISLVMSRSAVRVRSSALCFLSLFAILVSPHYLVPGDMAAAIIGYMLDIKHRMVVEHHGGDIRYASQPIDIGFHVRLSMDDAIDGEAPRNLARLLAAG